MPGYVTKKYDFNKDCKQYFKFTFRRHWYLIVIMSISSSKIEVLISNRLLYFLIN